MNYVVVTPAKNEETNIYHTLVSVSKQTVLPLEWIIVDDGSTDRTFQISDDFAKDHSWIKVVKYNTESEKRSGGAKVVRAFNYGYNKLVTTDYDIIVKLDGDLELPFNYFELILGQFESDPQLGMCGGLILNKIGKKLVPEGELNYHVRGAFKAVRRKCFQDIGGFREIWNWDGIDEMDAMHKGWKTKAIPVSVVHLRPTTDAYHPIKHSLKSGYEAFRARNSFLLTLMRSIKRIPEKPFVIRSMAYMAGYITAFFKREPFYIEKDLARFINRFHSKRIFKKTAGVK